MTLILISVGFGAGEDWIWGPVVWLAVIFVVAYAFVVTRLRRDGFSLGQSHSAIWREPAGSRDAQAS